MKKILVFLIVLFISVTAFGQADFLHVTAAGAGNNDGQTWANAFAMADFTTDVTTNAEAGDVYYLMDGAYTPGATWSNAGHGTAVAAISIIGVKTGTTNEDGAVVESDYSYGGDRPVIDMEANAWSVGDYWAVKNLDITSTSAFSILGAGNFMVQNCKVYNTNTNIAIVNTAAGGKVLDCEAQSAGDVAIQLNASSLLIGCYVHDSAKGLVMGSVPIYVVNNIFDECDIGIEVSSRNRCLITGNTIYGSDTIGISGTTAVGCIIINNILDACVVGVDWTTAGTSNYFDYNIWDNTDDIADTDVVKGPHAITADPGLADPAADPPDFTLQSGSNAIDAGLQIYALAGNLLGDYKVNIGADQDDNAAAGGRSAGANLGGVLQE